MVGDYTYDIFYQVRVSTGRDEDCAGCLHFANVDIGSLLATRQFLQCRKVA